MNLSSELKELLETGRLRIIKIPNIESINIGRGVGYDIIEHVPPAEIHDVSATKIREQMNWLNSSKGLFPYKWSLYSGGHANLDLTKTDWSEDMVRNRDPNTIMLGDSGGFQIAKGLWEGDWKANSGCAKAQKKRESVLTWLDTISNYGMGLDIPTWVIHDKKASDACQIKTLDEAVAALGLLHLGLDHVSLVQVAAVVALAQRDQRHLRRARRLVQDRIDRSHDSRRLDAPSLVGFGQQ